MKIIDPSYPWLPWIYRRPGEGGSAPYVAYWREYQSGGKTWWLALWHVIIYRVFHRFPAIYWRLWGPS